MGFSNRWFQSHCVFASGDFGLTGDGLWVAFGTANRILDAARVLDGICFVVALRHGWAAAFGTFAAQIGFVFLGMVSRYYQSYRNSRVGDCDLLPFDTIKRRYTRGLLMSNCSAQR